MSPIDLFALFRWWLVLVVYGAVAVPFSLWLFERLPDRGYAFSKLTGLLLANYVFWLLSTMGFIGNTIGGIVLGILGLAILSVYFYNRTALDIREFLRQRWRYILTVEALFLVLLVGWAWVRAQNPAITGTEKPMEFAFLNSAMRSPQYPPLDPWLSGFSISYYYFGYVVTGAIARLAAVPAAYAFNLGIAWLVASSGIGAFGLVYNLIMLAPITGRNLSRLAVTYGLMAAIAIPLAGNNQMLLEILHGNGVGSTTFWEWLDVTDINEAPRERPRFLSSDGSPNSSWWWWRSSRVIHEYHLSGREEAGLTPIAEFPGFSFVLGDMHPHVLALPYAFLLLAVSLSWFLTDDGALVRSRQESGWQAWIPEFIRRVGPDRFLISAMILGGLAFLNTWDVPIHLFILVGAYILARWRARGEWTADFLAEGLWMGLVFGATIYLLYLPFFMALSSQAGAPFILPMLMQPTRLSQFLIIFGMPLLVIVPLLIVLILSQQERGKSLWPAIGFGTGLPLLLLIVALFFSVIIGASEAGAGTVFNLANELGLTLPPRNPGVDFVWGFAAVVGLLPIYLLARVQSIGVTLLLSVMLGAVVFLWHASLRRQSEEEAPISPSEATTSVSVVPFVLLLVLTGALLTIGPEFVYLKDNFGQRLNTIFKFYYQAWILFGVAALFGLGYLIPRRPIWGHVTQIFYVSLLAVAILFPYYGVRSRAIEYRGRAVENRTPATLDGLAHVQRFNPDEYEAMMWLKENAAGSPIVLEATGNPYSDYARVSANTGLPTVLGWANHEFQWRGDSTPEPSNRIPLVDELYDTRDWNRAAALLDDYDVEYIFVGRIEQNDHPGPGLEKFAANLEVAFQNESVTIYRWQPRS